MFIIEIKELFEVHFYNLFQIQGKTEMKKVLFLITLVFFSNLSFSVEKDLIVKLNEPFNIHYYNDYLIFDLIILRSSIYAQKGYKFESLYLKKYFSKYNWYGKIENFKFSSIGKSDWNIIRSIDKLIESKINDSIKENANYKYFKEIDPLNNRSNKLVLEDLEIKYFLEANKILLPSSFIKKIEEVKKNTSINSNIWFPDFSNIIPSKEVSRKELEKMFEPFFNYYSVFYKEKKLIAILFDTTCGGECSYPVVYYDDNGKILYIKNQILFNSYQWSYIYDNETLIAIVFNKTYPNDSGTDLESTMQIFIQ